LFGWLTPWILIPTFLLEPVFQILFFASIGKAAGIQTDEFFLIGNAVVAAAIPCLFATGNTIEGERYAQTLGLLLASPARRLPLFLGRALPVILNGFLVAMFALIAGAWVLGVSLAANSLLPLTWIIAISAYSVTGLGLVAAALALRVRETAVLSNIVLGILLVFCGVNIPLDVLPQWMATTADYLPLTHGIEAARGLAAGSSLADVSRAAVTEFLVGTTYIVIGLILLRLFEVESRRTASLERA
jgi:ABC-2 type transport system permease protein